MNRYSDKKIQNISLSLVIVIFSILIYLLNRLYPIIGEDWDYSFLWEMPRSGSPTRIKNISDIFISQYNHYIMWGGRSVVHSIDQFLLMLGTTWHDLINTIACIGFIFLIYKIINYGNKTNVKIFLYVALLLWFCVPEFLSLVLWITYSAVYLWGNLLILAFIYPYYKYYRKSYHCNEITMSVIMFLSGIIAGWTYENMSIALVGFLVLLLFIMKYYFKEKVPKWMIVGLIGVVIGCAILLFAPGNFNRASSMRDTEIHILSRGWSFVKNYIFHILILSILYLYVFYLFLKKSVITSKKRLSILSLIFILSAHIGILVMIGSPIFPSRTLFGPIVLIIIAIGILYFNIDSLSKIYNKIDWILISIMLLFFTYDYVDKYKYINYLNDFWHQREVFVYEQKNKGVQDIVFTEGLIFKKGFILYDFKQFTDGWPNFAYAQYYGVRTVVIK